MHRQIAIDTETTGLEVKEGHRLIEVACVELIDRRITGSTYHCYINPERSIDAGAVAVHGLNETFLADKPLFADIAEEFIQYIQEAELIIHNAPFDVGFLQRELKLCRRKEILQDGWSVIDTLVMARQKYPRQKNNLDALCKRLSVDNSERHYHGALIDAQLLAKVYLAMTSGQYTLFGPESISTMNELASTQVVQSTDMVEQPLVLIELSEEDLQAHTDYLQQMKTRHAKVIWDKEL